MTHGRIRSPCGNDLIEDRPPIERRLFDDAVARADVLAHFLGQRLAIAEQVADTNASPPDLVLVRRPDAARRRADLALAPARLRQHVQLAVIRQDDVRLLADEQPAVDADAVARQLVDLHKQRLRIDDHAVADDARDAGMQDAGRNQVKDELLALHIHRVPGVVPTLVARNRREVRREHVDDLAFAFVAPLRPENCDIRLRHSVLFNTSARITN